MKTTTHALLSFLTLSLISMPAMAEINLNDTSNLADEGIESAEAPATILDGIPLFQGLQLKSDPTLKILPEFTDDKPVVTVGIADVDDVYNFYKRQLPPLGWTATSGRDYHKNNTNLHIHACAEGKLTTVTFTENASAP